MNLLVGVFRLMLRRTIDFSLIIAAGILMMNLLPTTTTEDGQYVTVGEVTQKVTKASYPALY